MGGGRVVLVTPPTERLLPSGGPSPPISGPGCRPCWLTRPCCGAARGREARRSKGRGRSGGEGEGRESAAPGSVSNEPRGTGAPEDPARCSPSPRPTWCQVREQVRVCALGPRTQIFLRPRCYAGTGWGHLASFSVPGQE